MKYIVALCLTAKYWKLSDLHQSHVSCRIAVPWQTVLHVSQLQDSYVSQLQDSCTVAHCAAVKTADTREQGNLREFS